MTLPFTGEPATVLRACADALRSGQLAQPLAQRTAVGRVMNDDRAEWTAAWQLFPGSIAYVWHAGLKAPAVAADLEAAGFKLRSQIIWVKQHFALSRGEIHWRHEPAWYAVRGKGQWCGDRRQTTVWEVANLNPMGGTRVADNVVTGHSTQKPVRLFEIPILNRICPSVGRSIGRFSRTKKWMSAVRPPYERCGWSPRGSQRTLPLVPLPSPPDPRAAAVSFTVKRTRP
jgi:hypothetical protein